MNLELGSLGSPLGWPVAATTGAALGTYNVKARADATQGTTAAARQDEIVARVCIPLDSPVIRAGPRLRKSRTPATVLSIRRSSRLAAKPQAANATLQAQSVLMRKLGLAVNVTPADKEAYEKYLAIFAEPLTPSKLEALQMPFTPDFDPVAMNLNLAELEGDAL